MEINDISIVWLFSNDNSGFKHPYYTEYEDLRQICLSILLEQNKLSYGSQSDCVYGVLISMPWLWEEYVGKEIIGQCRFPSITYEKKKSIQLFTNPAKPYNRSLDYFLQGRLHAILDAKYKSFEHKEVLNRDDVHQMIAYLYAEDADVGGVIYPKSSGDEKGSVVQDEGTLNGYGARIYRIAVPIPQMAIGYEDFCTKMEENEKKVVEEIQNLVL